MIKTSIRCLLVSSAAFLLLGCWNRSANGHFRTLLFGAGTLEHHYRCTTNPNMEAELIILSDGTFTQKITTKEQVASVIQGTWSRKNNCITFRPFASLENDDEKLTWATTPQETPEDYARLEQSALIFNEDYAYDPIKD